jgi:O-antigen ligase
MSDTPGPSGSPSSSGARRRRRSSRSTAAPSRKRARIDWFELVPTAAFLALALLLGGATDPLNDMAVRIAALVLILILVVRLSPVDARRLRPAWIATAAVAAVAAVELVPLPYALWRTLPGHAPLADLLDTLNLGGAARPLSLDPEATRATLIAVLPGLAAFAAALAAGRRSLGIWALVVIAGALATVLLGGFQVAGFHNFYPYEPTGYGQLTGLFASRNHASDLLLIGIALLAAQARTIDRRAKEMRPAIGALIVLLAISVVLTGSRFGIVLLGAELIVLALLLAPPRRRLRQALLVMVFAIAAVGLLLLFDPRIVGAFGRFASVAEDLRPQFWNGTLYATGQYWPFGSGLGTFVPIYATVEQLDTMPPQIVNHAHNEYLELTLELGLLGPVLILGYLGALVVAIVRHGRRDDPLFRVAIVGIGVLLAHSTNEFPLRNASLMAAFGLLNGIVFAASRQKVSATAGNPVSE